MPYRKSQPRDAAAPGNRIVKVTTALVVTSIPATFTCGP